MKKLFFSAVALIAFSSVSMANTIEIENINDKVELSQNKELTIIIPSESIKGENGNFCENWAMGRLLLDDPDDEMTEMNAFRHYHMWLKVCYSIQNIFN